MANSKKKQRAVTAAISQANKPRAIAMQGLRSSGAAGTHGDRRTKRNRTRTAQNSRAINEYT